jgi:replication factor A1
MYDFEALVEELLQRKPELSRDELMRRLEDKKQNVGAGYLTDQGALFLVAGELGVSLRKDGASSDMTIKDLYIGASDVTVVARILAVYPESTFNKKEGGKGRYRRFVLFDGKSTVRMTAWEEALEEIAKLGVEVDSPVRVLGAYVKQGLDGKPNLNLGKRGRMEVLSDENVFKRLRPVSAVAQKLPNLTKEEPFVAIEGIVSSEPRYSEFVRSDGSGGSLFQFGVADEDGKETRVVVWSPVSKPELRRGQKVRVTNVKARRSNGGGFEIHGDAGSAILVEEPTARWVLRIASTSSTQSAKLVLGIGKDKKVIVVNIGVGLAVPAQGELVEILPDEVVGGALGCMSPGSLRAVAEGSFPGLEELATKLQEAKEENSEIMVEVIALSHGTVDEVRLKDGTTAKKGELTIGDDTADVKLVAWRDLAGRLLGIQPGERLRLVGVSPKSTKMGGRVLQLSDHSVLERIRGHS